jgi:hypothetical protein
MQLRYYEYDIDVLLMTKTDTFHSHDEYISSPRNSAVTSSEATRGMRFWTASSIPSINLAHSVF